MIDEIFPDGCSSWHEYNVLTAKRAARAEKVKEAFLAVSMPIVLVCAYVLNAYIDTIL